MYIKSINPGTLEFKESEILRYAAEAKDLVVPHRGQSKEKSNFEGQVKFLKIRPD